MYKEMHPYANQNLQWGCIRSGFPSDLHSGQLRLVGFFAFLSLLSLHL